MGYHQHAHRNGLKQGLTTQNRQLAEGIGYLAQSSSWEVFTKVLFLVRAKRNRLRKDRSLSQRLGLPNSMKGFRASSPMNYVLELWSENEYSPTSGTRD
jgi:hypothetical protein